MIIPILLYTLILVPPLGSRSIFYWYLYEIVFRRFLECIRFKNKKIKCLVLFKNYRITHTSNNYFCIIGLVYFTIFFFFLTILLYLQYKLNFYKSCLIPFNYLERKIIHTTEIETNENSFVWDFNKTPSARIHNLNCRQRCNVTISNAVTWKTLKLNSIT